MTNKNTVTVKAAELEENILRSLERLAHQLGYLNSRVSALISAAAALRTHGRHVQVRGHSTVQAPMWQKIDQAAKESGGQANLLAVRLEVLARVTEHESEDALPTRKRTKERHR